MYKKHYPPALNDEVWRLEKIGKDGSFHKRLNKNGIFSVEDFLRMVVRDSQKLRSVSVVTYFGTLLLSFSIFIKFFPVCRSLVVVCQIKCGRLS